LAATKCDLVVYGKILNEQRIAVFENGRPVEDDPNVDGKRLRVELMSGELQVLEVLYPAGEAWPDGKRTWVTFTRPVNWRSNMQNIFFEKALYTGSIFMLEHSVTGMEIREDMDVKYLEWLRSLRDREVRQQTVAGLHRKLTANLEEQIEVRDAEDLNRVDPFHPTEEGREQRLAELKEEERTIREKLLEWQAKPCGDEPGHSTAEQDGAGQPATRRLAEPEGSDKPQPEAEGRSR
jgi:hypothetical protein